MGRSPDGCIYIYDMMAVRKRKIAVFGSSNEIEKQEVRREARTIFG